ncbi:tumor susceptibility gene 101 protein [Poeciliopsis prolifica]|uniref:tumor susceptibility gene 101 protein n=1 Tax=Poeciliopsis prolifica TaxID=188132 RepID=UPI002413C47E|nr:tumor susceptibility gene 101 protein [Poeciliopsis prolifica]
MKFTVQTIRKMLPKEYLRKYVAHQIFDSMYYFKNLVPKMDEYVYKDGTTKSLMNLTGTLPVVYSGETYNIPICVWIEPNYPNSPPMCYVKPTPEMIIIKGQYISSDGEVTVPYLKAWKKSDCDLSSLLQLMAIMFGEFPPLAMRSHQEPEQASCWLQFNKEADGRYCVSLPKGDGQPFQHENETSC